MATLASCQVLCTPNGSMTRKAFPYWCRHYVASLPKGQSGTRTDAEYQLLFLDGHSSRWSIEGLSILKEANVLAICLPSHTSIWSQVSLFVIRATVDSL